MKTTMIIYESHHGSAKKAAMILGTIIGNTKIYEVDEAPETINFNNLVVVFGFYGYGTAKSTIAYLSKVKDQIAEKPMPKDVSKEKIEELLESQSSLALATAKEDWVHCTPH